MGYDVGSVQESNRVSDCNWQARCIVSSAHWVYRRRVSKLCVACSTSMVLPNSTHQRIANPQVVKGKGRPKGTRKLPPAGKRDRPPLHQIQASREDMHTDQGHHNFEGNDENLTQEYPHTSTTLSIGEPRKRARICGGCGGIGHDRRNSPHH